MQVSSVVVTKSPNNSTIRKRFYLNITRNMHKTDCEQICKKIFQLGSSPNQLNTAASLEWVSTVQFLSVAMLSDNLSTYSAQTQSPVLAAA
jgi:hypothetical protein